MTSSLSCISRSKRTQQKIFKNSSVSKKHDLTTLIDFTVSIFGDFLQSKSRKFCKFAKFSCKSRIIHRQSPARHRANLQISRLAVYNIYIPQTGIDEFAPFPLLFLEICKKFANIPPKICRICKTLRKNFDNFLEFYGGAGDP